MDVNSMRLFRYGTRDGTRYPWSCVSPSAGSAPKSVEAIGRNPEASSKVQTMAILAIAFAEAVAIYALVIALIIKFVA